MVVNVRDEALSIFRLSGPIKGESFDPKGDDSGFLATSSLDVEWTQGLLRRRTWKTHEIRCRLLIFPDEVDDFYADEVSAGEILAGKLTYRGILYSLTRLEEAEERAAFEGYYVDWP